MFKTYLKISEKYNERLEDREMVEKAISDISKFLEQKKDAEKQESNIKVEEAVEKNDEETCETEES